MWNQVKGLIDLWTTIFLNLYNTYKAYGDIFFYITIAIVVILPIFRRMIRSFRGGR